MTKEVQTVINHLGQTIDIILRSHPTAKRMRLRIDTKSGKGLVVMPKYCTQKKAIEFAQTNASWLLGKISNVTPQIIIENNETISVFGKELTIKHQKKLRGITTKTDTEIQVFGEPELIGKNVTRFLKQEMQDYVFDVAMKYSGILNCPFTKIKIKDTSSRWGSCNSKGEISICWKLIFAPRPVLNYIIIHEVVHLKHFNHSEAFWETVKSLCPNYEKAQKWLKCNGATIQNTN